MLGLVLMLMSVRMYRCKQKHNGKSVTLFYCIEEVWNQTLGNPMCMPTYLCLCCGHPQPQDACACACLCCSENQA